MTRPTPCRTGLTEARAAPLGPRPWLLPLVLLLMLGATGGCGFHLRGSVEIPDELNPVFIQAPAGSPLRDAIVQRVAGGAVQLAPSASTARLILRIQSEQRSSRVAAVDANGKILAFELHYVVRFDAVGPDGAQLLPPQTLDLVNNFDNPDVEVLGKQLEEELIYRDFITDAADRILMRLRAALL